MGRQVIQRWMAVIATSFAAAVFAQAQKPAAPDPTQARKSKEPWEYLKEPAFKHAYMKVLGSKSQTAWLTRRDGPAPEDKFITIGGQRYVVNTFCANHACQDNSALLLYQPDKKVVYGTIYERGKTTYIGDPPAAVAPELARLWKKEWRSGLQSQ